MTDQELANKLSEILLYNELSEKAEHIIDKAYMELKGEVKVNKNGF